MAATTIEEIKAEYNTYIKGKTLAEYIKTSRIGAKFTMTRKERADLYNSLKRAVTLPEWADYLNPKKTDLSHLGGLEKAILDAQGDGLE